MTKLTQPKPIKPFKTLQQEAEYWDTQDLSSVMSVANRVSLRKDAPKQESLTVRMNSSLKLKLAHQAKSRGLNASTLARMWLTEKIQAINI